MFMPFQVLGMWFRGLFGLLFLAGAVYLLTLWYRNREHVIVEQVEVPQTVEKTSDGSRTTVMEERRTTVYWKFGLNRETAFLLSGLTLLGWSLGGGWSVYPRFFRRRGHDEPHAETAVEARRLRLADGSELHIELHGPADGDPLVVTHGWGLDQNEWYYLRKQLGTQYRVITWDLPGLGKSDRPTDRDWSLEKLAQNLRAVIATAGGKPVTLVGHSIGAMITLTFCKLYPTALGTEVDRLILAHGTYTNPVKTTAHAALYSALQKPILEPLCHLMVWFSPVVRVLNWVSYLNGSAHRSTEQSSFSGNETRGQLDFLTRYYCTSAPDVVGRGMLAMLRFDATSVLRQISIPTLVVCGDDDRTCLPQASQYMVLQIPGAELLMLVHAKHCGQFEHHDEFHSRIRAFLAAPQRLVGAHR